MPNITTLLVLLSQQRENSFEMSILFILADNPGQLGFDGYESES